MELAKYIKDFYRHPVKSDMDGNLHSIQITSLQMQYCLTLGLDYCIKVIPKVNTSITFIQKP